MFYCVLHNWFSSENPCPACHPVRIVTTSNEIVIEKEEEKEEYYHIHDNSDAFQEWLNRKDVRFIRNGHYTSVPNTYNIFQLGMEFGVYKKENQFK